VVQLRQRLLFLLRSLQPLGLGRPQLLFQLLDVPLLVVLAVVQSRKGRDEVFDLLLLVNEVARELQLASPELVRREWFDVFLRLLLLQLSYRVVWPQSLEVMVSIEVVDARDKLLRQLRRASNQQASFFSVGPRVCRTVD